MNGALNALKACAKTPSVKRFVFTSSSLAATLPKPNVEFSIDTSSYNEEAVEIAREEPTRKGLFIYAAMKTETEKAVWKWMQENKPGLVLNTIVCFINLSILEKNITERHVASQRQFRPRSCPTPSRVSLNHRLGPRSLDRRRIGSARPIHRAAVVHLACGYSDSACFCADPQ